MLEDIARNHADYNENRYRMENGELLLKKLTDQLPVAVYQFLKYPGGDSWFLYVSNGLTDIFNITPEELLKNDQALRVRVHPDDVGRVDAAIENSVRFLQIWDCEFRVVLPERGLRWIRGVARPEKLDDGGVLSHGYLEDITDNKKAYEWVRYLNTALMNISESVVISNMDGIIIYANQKVKETHGYEPDEIIGKTIINTMNVTMTEEKYADMIKALDDGLTYTSTDISRRKDGSTFLCEYSVTPIHGDESATAIGVQRDITDRTRIMEALRESNERFEQLTQHSRAIAWEMNTNGIFVYISGAVDVIFGYKPNELVEQGNAFDLMLPSVRYKMRRGFQHALNKKKSFSSLSCPFNDRFGNVIFLTINGIPRFNKSGQIKSYQGLAIDNTEKAKMEQRISDEEERYRTTLLSVGEGVISTDRAGNITVMNPLAEEMTGQTQKDAVGKYLDDVLKIMDEHNGRICESPANIVLRTSKTFKPCSPMTLISISGKEIPIEIIAAPIKNFIGKISGVVIVFRDFSDYLKRQKQIEFLSYHDHLTGLYNRHYLEKALKKYDLSTNLPLTIMTLDVNGLKLTNDAFGHAMGDRLLQTVADILRKVCRKDEIIARIGGDEFAILLPRTDGDNAELIKQRILRAAMTAKFDTVIVSLAAGYSVKTSMLERVETVFMNADRLMYKEKLSLGKKMRNETIERVLQTINSKVEQEQIHTQRVSQYCYLIADAFNLCEKDKTEISIAGLLHDIGKIMVPTELLKKPGKLTDEEFGIIKRHPETGYQILKSAEEYATIAQYVLHHHERWDGTGYPAGLRGEQIPFQSRIIAVADAYEAMTAKRPYQKTLTNEEAIKELRAFSNTQFDPAVVKMFLEAVISEEQENSCDL